MGEFYFVIFNFYIAFCVIGLFNVVTGVFVDSAVCTRTEDEIVQAPSGLCPTLAAGGHLLDPCPDLPDR